MKRIGVFCSASGSLAPLYYEQVRQLGEWLGEHDKTVIFGGADMGLMATLAAAVKSQGGRTVGVVPQLLVEHGRVCKLLDETIYTRDLSDRKDILVRESDVLLALPGGIGTLDELFHVMAAHTIGYHHKRVIFYNIDGFWNSLLAVLEEMAGKGFVRTPREELFAVADTLEEIICLLDEER